VGLRGLDLRNDEAIYSYAVDRILETGEWLTPRAIFTDDHFLEKPPLKFWLVAGAMKIGLLPFDDAGMRFFDALFSACAYMYVFALARRIAGTVAGVLSVLVLFSYDPLFYWHGIRENQMEASLFFAYCGGVYHFMRWADERGREAKPHAFAFAGYFFLAFMTKFVAAAFLPIVCSVGLLLGPGLAVARARAREWLAPAAVAIAAIVPWFAYQLIHSGREFVEIIFTQHIVVRFTGTLIASHRAPWNYYFLQTWKELGYAAIQSIVALGLVALVFRAWRERDWVARLILVWWLLPVTALSLGTSKLLYYAHPFVAPLAIGAGLAASQIFQIITQRGRQLMVRIGLKGLSSEQEAARRSTVRGRLLAAFGVVCFGVSIWTAFHGPIQVELGGVRVFQNGSVARPIAIGALVWYFAGLGSLFLRLVAVSVLAMLLPVDRYTHRVERLTSTIDHPIRAARDCAVGVQAAHAMGQRGVFDAAADLHHAYFYYLRRLGPWLEARLARPDELQRRLEDPAEQSVVLMSADDYKMLGGNITPAPTGGSREGPAPEVRPAHTARLTKPLPPGITIGNVVVMLFPGPYAVCVDPVAKAGSIALGAR
jgi:dolichyl-phosphate-mannose-protein mannosyltransferase